VKKHPVLMMIFLLLSGLICWCGCGPETELEVDDFKISDQLLSSAVIGQEYKKSIKATGGLEPYINWEILEGALPAGIQLAESSGVLYGTPAGPAGFFPILVKAEDSDRDPQQDIAALAVHVQDQGGQGPLVDRMQAFDTAYWDSHAPSGLGLSVLDGEQDEPYTDYDRAGFVTGFYLATAAYRYESFSPDGQEEQDDDLEEAGQALSDTLAAVHDLLQVTGGSGLLASGFERDSIQLLCCDDLEDPDCDEQHLCGGGVPEGHAGEGDYSGYHWIGDAGRDTYTAVIFGLTLAYDFADDTQAKNIIENDMAAMLDRIWDDGLEIIDVDGEPTTLGNVSGDTPDRNSNRALAALAWLKAASHVTGESRFDDRYQELLGDRDYRAIVTGPTDIYPGYDTDFQDALLSSLNLLLLLRLEQDEELYQVYYYTFLDSLWTSEPGYRRGDADKNALLNMMVMAGLRFWPDRPLYEAWSQMGRFPDPPLKNRAVDLSSDPNVEKDPEREGWAADALWIDQRAPSSFGWADNPYLLAGGADDGRIFPGVDFMLPYWLARYHGFILPQW